jgi:exosortase B
MPTVLQSPDTLRFPENNPLLAWWPVLLGFLALYLPTYYDLAHNDWDTEAQAHGPIVLAVSLFLIWQQRKLLQSSAAEKGQSYPVTGWIVLAAGLLLYAIGRSQGLILFEVGSQIPVLLGAFLIVSGMSLVRALWFPLFFLLFMVPLPGFLVDAITGPLKEYISVITEQVLYAAGYPIARIGVVLTIGQYQLLVADACSGLHSMFSLSAMGLLYLHLMRRTSMTRNLILIAAILPIAFVANVVRVIILVLVTYHLGDEAGQGFLHGFAGLLLFVVGVLCLFMLDAVLGLFLPDRARSTSNQSKG